LLVVRDEFAKKQALEKKARILGKTARILGKNRICEKTGFAKKQAGCLFHKYSGKYL